MLKDKVYKEHTNNVKDKVYKEHTNNVKGQSVQGTHQQC